MTHLVDFIFSIFFKNRQQFLFFRPSSVLKNYSIPYSILFNIYPVFSRIKNYSIPYSILFNIYPVFSRIYYRIQNEIILILILRFSRLQHLNRTFDVFMIYDEQQILNCPIFKELIGRSPKVSNTFWRALQIKNQRLVCQELWCTSGGLWLHRLFRARSEY